MNKSILRNLTVSICSSAFLISCQTTDTVSESKSVQSSSVNLQAYEAHRVEPSVGAFSELCFARPVTINKQREVAEKYNMGASGPTRFRREGRPSIQLAGVYNGEALPLNGEEAIAARNFPIELRLCHIAFRGQWSDTVAGKVISNARSAGFRVVSTTPRKSFSDERLRGEAVKYSWIVSRSGVNYELTVENGRAGISGRTRYISGTRISLDRL